MTQKTYAITNLVDWKAQISAGKAKVIVHFTGGAITTYGITPAEYTTSNPLFQHVIEDSDYFKSGRITLLREVEVEDDAATKARKMREAQRKAAEEAQRKAETENTPAQEVGETENTPAQEVGETENTPAQEVGETEEEPQPASTDGNPQADEKKDEVADGDDADNAETKSDTANTDGKTVVEASCREDVVEYLKTNFSYTATQLRTKGALMQALNDHNLVVVGVEL